MRDYSSKSSSVSMKDIHCEEFDDFDDEDDEEDPEF